MAETASSEADAQEGERLDPAPEGPSPPNGRRPALDPVLHARFIYLMGRGEREKAASIACEKLLMGPAEAEEYVDRLWQRHQAIDWSDGISTAHRHQVRLRVLAFVVVAGVAWLVWYLLLRQHISP